MFPGQKCVDGRLEYIGHLMYNEYVTGKYINRQIMMAVLKAILFVHKKWQNIKNDGYMAVIQKYKF